MSDCFEKRNLINLFNKKSAKLVRKSFISFIACFIFSFLPTPMTPASIRYHFIQNRPSAGPPPLLSSSHLGLVTLRHWHSHQAGTDTRASVELCESDTALQPPSSYTASVLYSELRITKSMLVPNIRSLDLGFSVTTETFNSQHHACQHPESNCF